MTAPVIVSVTPTMARAWLARITHNLKPDPVRLAAYTRLMLSGAWDIALARPGEPITFSLGADRAFQLVDGQHRLRAVLIADIPATMYVSAPYPEVTS